MTLTREARLTTVIERSSVSEHYFIYDAEGGKQEFAPNSPQWFAWLASHRSFHFRGAQGHFTARQEKKQRGEGYWYAYRKASGQQHKRYLGATRTLTLTHLEEVALALHQAVLGSLPEPLQSHFQKDESSHHLLGIVLELLHLSLQCSGYLLKMHRRQLFRHSQIPFVLLVMYFTIGIPIQ